MILILVNITIRTGTMCDGVQYHIGIPDQEAVYKIVNWTTSVIIDVSMKRSLHPRLSLFELILGILSKYIHYFAFHRWRYAFLCGRHYLL